MSQRIVIAAGGTGGHLFPAQALCVELKAKLPELQLLFVAKGLADNPRFNSNLYDCVDISSSVIKSDFKTLLRAAWQISKGIWQSLRALRRFSPDLVVGFGSFHTFPVLTAAYLLGIPIVLHEANRIPGKVNRLFSKVAAWTGIYFPDTAKVLKGKSKKTDIPLRPQFHSGMRPDRHSGLAFYGLSVEAVTVLVFGGSLGAKKLNELAAKSLCLLKEKKKLQVLHFTGSFSASQEVRNAYQKAKLSAVVRDFESEMQYAWAAADLCLSRSGACTIAEQMTYGVPALFIPYPFAADDHQEKNALYVAECIGGAECLKEKGLEPDHLADALDRLLSQDSLGKMKHSLGAAQKAMQGNRFSDLLVEYLEESQK